MHPNASYSFSQEKSGLSSADIDLLFWRKGWTLEEDTCQGTDK